MPRGPFQCPHPCGEPLAIHTSAGGPPTLAGRFVSVSCGVPAPLLWVFMCTKLCVCVLQDWSLCFPQSSGRPIINLTDAQSQILWGYPVPLSDPQVGKPDMQFRTFTIVRELLWYYCSPVWGSTTSRVWDLIWSWLCPSYHLVEASLSLDVRCLFCGFQCPPVNSCSTASCNCGALTVDECTSFYSAILNWKPSSHSLKYKILFIIHWWFVEKGLKWV